MRLTTEQTYTLLERFGCYVKDVCDKCGRILGLVRNTRRGEPAERHCEKIGKDNTPSESMIDGASALSSARATAMMWRLSTITSKERTDMNKSERRIPPVHPGEILLDDFMKPLGLTVNKLALELHVPATRIGEIVHERRRITAETALRLARYFHTNAEFWLNLQNFYDLEVSRRSGKASEIERQVNPAPSLAS
jgi:addiction module HigA family antidote